MASRGSAAAGQQQQQQAAAPPPIVMSYPLVQHVSPHFSLARVVADHVGIVRIRRLLFIAERCPTLSVEAFRLALTELKSAQPQRTFAATPAKLSEPAHLGPNSSLYADVVQRAQQLLQTPSNQSEHAWFLSAGTAAKVASDPVFAIDNTFYQQAYNSVDSASRNLDAAVSQQKRDGEREGIKTALLHHAELLLNRGEINMALSKLQEAKEFVTPQAGVQQQQEVLHIALCIIRASILSTQFSHVKTQVQRAQRIVKELQAGSASSQQQQQGSASSAQGMSAESEKELAVISAKLHAAHGLFHLKNAAYHSAAQSFVQVTSDLGHSYADVLSSSDVVTYASVCALASFSRKELKELLQQNVEFKKMLDTHAPTTWKLILNQFYNSNYAKVFELMESIKNDLYLDVFLQQHVNRLVKQIRERAFIQYFQAYVSVSLTAMSTAFNMDTVALERTLAELIGEGKIAARIDSHSKVLYAKHSDARSDTFAGAMELGGRYARDVRALLLRLSLVEHDVAVRSAVAEGKRKNAGPSSASAAAVAVGGVGGVAAAGAGLLRIGGAQDDYDAPAGGRHKAH